MENFIKAIKKHKRIRNNINVMLDRYMAFPYEFRSRIGYNSLIQNVILKELINMLCLIIVDLDIEIKIKKLLYFIFRCSKFIFGKFIL